MYFIVLIQKPPNCTKLCEIEANSLICKYDTYKLISISNVILKWSQNNSSCAPLPGPHGSILTCALLFPPNATIVVGFTIRIKVVPYGEKK